MDATCRRLRPLLFKIVEGESTPDEALAVGRHVHDCTVCRIVLARSRRLAKMVDAMGDPIEVDESFLTSVMATLPEHPASVDPAPARRGRLGLKLAGVAIALGFGGAATFGSPVWPAIETAARGMRGPQLELGARVVTGVETVARVLVGLVVGAGSSPTIEFPGGAHFPPAAVLLVLIPLLILGFAISGALSIAVYGVSRGFSPIRDP